MLISPSHRRHTLRTSRPSPRDSSSNSLPSTRLLLGSTLVRPNASLASAQTTHSFNQPTSPTRSFLSPTHTPHRPPRHAQLPVRATTAFHNPRLQSQPQPTLRSPPPSIHPSSLSGLQLSSRAQAKLQRALSGSLADSTSKKYDYALANFLAFCDTENIPAAARLPASEDLLCAFAANNVGLHSASTARNAINAVRAWHLAAGVSWLGGARLSKVLKGVENLAPPERPARPALSVEMLATIVSGLDPTNKLDMAVAAVATVAFWGQARMGELLPTVRNPTNMKAFPTRRHLSEVSATSMSRSLSLPFTKTKRWLGDSITITRQPGRTDPLKALAHHLDGNLVRAQDLLFSYLAPDGISRAILTQRAFLRRCNDILLRHDLPKISCHCFRIGGTTALLLSGVDPEFVKRAGRWASDSFLRYWRQDQQLAESHIADRSVVLS